MVVRMGQKKKSMEYNSRSRRGVGINASYLEPDREVDLEEDISAIKSSIKSRIGMKRAAADTSRMSSDEEEVERRLTRAKEIRAESPPPKRRSRKSRGGTQCLA